MKTNNVWIGVAHIEATSNVDAESMGMEEGDKAFVKFTVYGETESNAIGLLKKELRNLDLNFIELDGDILLFDFDNNSNEAITIANTVLEYQTIRFKTFHAY